jgi:predicted RND superfamily exporter protein
VFAVIAFLAARSVGVAAAMTLSFLMIPVALLGILGYLGTPQDIISVSAADVALGLAIDDMLHVATHVRRKRQKQKKSRGWEDWVEVRSELWRATAGGSMVVSIGFSILFLSAFPPTRRLGLAVVLATLISLTLVLTVFPRLAFAFERKK